MGSGSNRHIRIEGTVAPGFESVKLLYEHNMQTLAEKNTQLCVYFKNEKVVDLWGSASGDTEFSPDSLVNVFSSGKSFEAIALAWLVGEGRLDYDTKISDYWPEFSAMGKGGLTVAQLMRHEAGLAAFDTSLDPEDLLRENIKQNAVGAVIEGHAQKFRAGTGNSREYHAMTRGWIANEIFRRVDLTGRTIGEFLQENLSTPLEVDAIIGVPEQDLGRISKVSPLGFLFQFLHSLRPKFLGRKIEHNIFQILGRIIRLIPAIRSATTRSAPPPYTGMKGISFFNEPIVAMGETPSANATCSARGLAKIAAMMASGGSWADTQYLSQTAWQALHDKPVDANMMSGSTTFTQGGVAFFRECSEDSTRFEKAFNDGREGFYGWMGFGGSIFQWHPQHEIGFGYVPTSLNFLDILNERGKAYQSEVLKCVAQIRDKAEVVVPPID